MMRHHRQSHNPHFDPYLTSHKEDYESKAPNPNCQQKFVNEERGLDRLYAYNNGTGPERRPTTTYTAYHGSVPNRAFVKDGPVGRPEVRPSSAFYQAEAEIEQAAQKVFRPTTEYRDQYMGARPAMQPASYGVRFSEHFEQDYVPRNQRSSQHRVHDNIPHAQVKNPYLNNPEGTRFANAKNDPLTTGIVPTTLPKSAKSPNNPTNRLDSTTYGVVHSRPFSGVCAHGRPQNYPAAQPGYAPPAYTDYPGVANNNIRRPSSPGFVNYDELVSVPTLPYHDDDVDVDNVDKSSYRYRPNNNVNMRPPSPPPPAPAPQPRPPTRQQRSPSPPPSRGRQRSPTPDNNNNRWANQRDNNNIGNPYGAIPEVSFRRMSPPTASDTMFDMGDGPDYNNNRNNSYNHQPPKRYQQSTEPDWARAGNNANKNDSKNNLSNIDAILRDADALSQNIRSEVSRY